MSYQNTTPLTDDQVFSRTNEGMKAERESAMARIRAKRKQVVEVCYWTSEGNECVTQFVSVEGAIEWKSLTDRQSPGFIVAWFPRGWVAS